MNREQRSEETMTRRLVVKLRELTFTSGDETATDEDHVYNQIKNSFPIVIVFFFFKSFSVMLFFHQRIRLEM